MEGGLDTRRGVAVGALLVVFAIVLYLVLSGGSSNRFSVVVPQAASLVSGSDVKAPGATVGKVTDVEPVEGGHAAKVEMEISDDDYWPISTDTQLAIRLGGTVSFSNRYVELIPSTNPGATNIDDGGQLPSANVEVPVEVDELTQLFTKQVRSDFRRLIGNTADMLERGGPILHDVLPKVAPVAEGGGRIFADLVASEDDLRTLVRSTGHVVNAIDSSDPTFGTLLEGAGQTFNAIAAESTNLQTTLDRFPAALQQTRSTLDRADSTLQDTADLAQELGPGIVELRRSAGPVTDVLASLRQLAPIGESTLRTANQRAPEITGLLDSVNNVSPTIESVAKQATTQIGCLRPYSPELVGVGSIWGAWESYTDNKDHLLRAQVESFLPSPANNMPITPGQAADLFPGFRYGFPYPPGSLVGQPWFQPECGITPDVVNPDKDPEAEHPDPAEITAAAGEPGTGDLPGMGAAK